MKASFGRIFAVGLIVGVGQLLAPNISLAAGDASRQPVLMLEIGNHISMVSRISADAAGRFLVSASNDKTARIWSLASGGLKGVIRAPVGMGKEGMFYAAAISPDGRRVAAGGWITGVEGGYRILMYDREAGKSLQPIKGLPQVALHLEFSPDGRFLAVALASRGIRVFDTATGRLVAQDASPPHGVEFLDFDQTGTRIVASLHDGSLRLYGFNGAALSLLAKKQSVGGQMPRSLRFSPDGKKVAVGFDDSTVVNVVSGETLDLLYSPKTPIGGGTLSSVAWSLDGGVLFAAGEWRGQDGYMVRKWQQAGQGNYSDFVLSNSPIVDLRALPDDSVAYATKTGIVGVFTGDGGTRRLGSEVAAKFSTDQQFFRVSDLGDRIQVRMQTNGKMPILFDAQSGTLVNDVDSSLAAPRLEAPGISLTNWEDRGAPKLNGRPLTLKQGDQTNTVAISADAKLVAVGTEWMIYAFDHMGKPVWTRPSPASVVGLNFSGNGRYLIAALEDGTLRWVRTSDGRDVLAVFFHADGRRWLAWTPQGDYDASPGAEGLFGWHVGKASDSEPEFLPASTFRGKYYKPSLASQVLSGDPGRTAIVSPSANIAITSTPSIPPSMAKPEPKQPQRPSPVAANIVVPLSPPTTQVQVPASTAPIAAPSPFSQIVSATTKPKLQIVSPSNDIEVATTDLVVRYAVETPPSAPVKTIYAVINDQTIAFPVTRNLEVAEGSYREISLAVPPKDSEVMIFAENVNGLGPPAILRIKWRGRK